MTLIELLFFVGNVAFLAGFCWVGAKGHGLPGAIVGVLSGLVVLIAFYGGLKCLGGLWHKWRPLRPVCRNGVCRPSDYEWLPPKDGFLTCRCACGSCYLIKANRFLD